jgi:hypothetical protein
VIEAWVAMRRVSEGESAANIYLYVGLLRAIRKDFGHQDLLLEDRDLLRVVTNEELETLTELDAEPKSG